MNLNRRSITRSKQNGAQFGCLLHKNMAGLMTIAIFVQLIL